MYRCVYLADSLNRRTIGWETAETGATGKMPGFCCCNGTEANGTEANGTFGTEIG